MYSQISVSIANKEVKRTGSKRIPRPRFLPICPFSVFGVPLDHGGRWRPMRPFDLAPYCVCTWLLKVTPRNCHTIAHCCAAILDVVEIARNCIDVNVPRFQPIVRSHSLR